MQILFICLIVFVLVYSSTVIRKKGFDNLTITREIDKNKVFQGEEFCIKTVVTNNKGLPIPFILVKEKISSEFQYVCHENQYIDDLQYHTSKYSIGKYEIKKKKCMVKALNRGVYLIKDIEVTIGDFWGIATETREISDSKEIVVYPKIRDISNYKFSSTSISGDNVIKRWIYKDPLYIKGIREYNTEDRMKDIHWKSSLKMQKLMVKEYDYTSERELVIITNVECCSEIWNTEHEVVADIAINVAASLASKAIKSGIATGMWTNAKVISSRGNYSKEVLPSLNSLEKILELCARMYYVKDMSFYSYLQKNLSRFKNNCTYIIIAPFINETSITLIKNLAHRGMDIKLIDVSKDLNIPEIKGIQKINFKGSK